MWSWKPWDIYNKNIVNINFLGFPPVFLHLGSLFTGLRNEVLLQILLNFITLIRLLTYKVLSEVNLFCSENLTVFKELIIRLHSDTVFIFYSRRVISSVVSLSVWPGSPLWLPKVQLRVKWSYVVFVQLKIPRYSLCPT